MYFLPQVIDEGIIKMRNFLIISCLMLPLLQFLVFLVIDPNKSNLLIASQLPLLDVVFLVILTDLHVIVRLSRYLTASVVA